MTADISSQALACRDGAQPPSLEETIHTLVAAVVAITFGLSTLMLATYHWQLVLKNRSTIEDSYTSPWPYDLGRRRNFEAVFGRRWWLWPLPVYSTLGDGLTYARRDVTTLV